MWPQRGELVSYCTSEYKSYCMRVFLSNAIIGSDNIIYLMFFFFQLNSMLCRHVMNLTTFSRLQLILILLNHGAVHFAWCLMPCCCSLLCITVLPFWCVVRIHVPIVQTIHSANTLLLPSMPPAVTLLGVLCRAAAAFFVLLFFPSGVLCVYMFPLCRQSTLLIP